MKLKHLLNHVLLPWMLVLASYLTGMSQIYYKAERDASGTYRVYMRSTNSSSNSTVFLGTSQVTFVVPTGTFANLPQGTGSPTVTSYVGTWSANARTNGPTITGAQIGGSPAANAYTGLDFVSFGLGPGAQVPGGIVAGREYLLFSFTTNFACVPSARLWQPGDPEILQVNGASTATVVNQISANGMGSSGNLYLNNYGTNPPPCAVADLTPGVGPVPALNVGQTASLPVSLSNIGNASSNASLSMVTTLPANFSAPASFANNGWNCVTTGNLVSCTNPMVLSAGSSVGYTIPVTPLAAAANTTPVFNALVLSILDANTANNSASATGPMVGTAVAVGAPDLVAGMGPIPSLTVGVSASIPVSVSNIGTAGAAGPISFVTVLPASVTAASFFTNNGWACSVNSQTVSCQTASSLTAGSSTNFTIPVTPIASGSTPSFTGIPSTPTTESNLANNASAPVSPLAPIAPAPVAGAPDLVASMGPIPSLTAGVQSSIPVSVSNVGTASAAGPITFVTTLPASVTSPSFFTSGNWACSTTGQTVSCQTGNALSAVSSTAFLIPVTPVTAGATPIFVGTTTTPTIESNSTNNASAPAASSAPIASAGGSGGNPPSGTSCVPCSATGVKYGIKLGIDGITYTVYMLSTTTYAGNLARISTAQATIKLPRSMSISNIVSLQPNTNWTAQRVSPIETPTLDYISFGYSQTPVGAAFAITANDEIPLFSFQRVGSACPGGVALWSGYSATANTPSSGSPDPFQGASTNTVPGNQMTILGYGTPNAWQCNYACQADCPTNQLTLVKQGPTTGTQNTPFAYTFTVTNVGVTATAVPIIVTDVLPAGVQAVSGGGNGWTCGVVGQTVSCTFTGSIPAPGSNVITLIVNPTQVGNVANSATLMGGGTPAPVASQPCTNCAAGPVNTLISGSNSDLTLSMSWAGALLAGQGTMLNVTLANAANGLATGPQTVSLVIPAGMMAPTGTFAVSGGWTCTTSGTLITCTNPASLSVGQSLSLPLSLTPGASLINNPIMVTGQAAVLANELTGGNNFNFAFGTVLGADLSITFGAMPVLSAGQTTSLPLTISNFGQASAPGNLSVSVMLPTGVSLNNTIALSAGWSVIGSTPVSGGTLLQLQYDTGGSFASGSVVNLNLPISVGSGVSNALPFSAAVTPNPFELITQNNTANANSTVVGSTDLSVTISGPTPAFVVNQPSTVVFAVTNTSSQTASGPFSLSITLPAGYTYQPNTITPGWFVGSSVSGPGGTTLVMNNGSPQLLPLNSLTMSLGMTPPANSSGVIGTIGAVVGAAPGEVVLLNNTATMLITPSAPGIVATVQLPGSFTGGVASNVNILFTNTGSTIYNGPISTTLILPVGTVPGTLPSGWSYGTPITNGNGTISYPILGPVVNLPIGGSALLTVPVTPPVTSGNSSLTVMVVTPAIPSVPSSNVTVVQVAPVLVAPAPNVQVSVSSSTPTWSVGQPTYINVNLTNTGSAAVNGATSLTISLPAGVQLSPGQLPAGWVLNSSVNGPNGTIIYYLSNPNVFVSGGGGTSTIQLPVVIGPSAAGSSSLSVNVSVLPAPASTPSSGSFVMLTPVGTPNLMMTVGQPSPSLVVGQTSYIPVSLSNTGSATAYGPLTVQVVMPAGVSLNPAALNLPTGWLLSGTALQGGQVVATFVNANSNGLASGSAQVLNIPVVPGAGTLNTQPLFQFNWLLGQTVVQSQSLITLVPVQNLSTPDLTILGGQALPALSVGQQSNIPITIQNIGGGAANGPISFQISLPTGMSLNPAQLPAGWAVSGSSAILGGTVYTLTNNSLSLAALGGSTVVNVPVIPGASLGNATLTLGLYALPATGEVVVSNNGNTLLTNVPVQPLATPDLQVSIPSGQSFALVVGQSSLVSFNVTNTGSASAAAPLTLQFTMPVGFSTATSSFATAGWQCLTSNNVVTCTNLNGMAVNGSSAITIPVVPLGASAGVVNPSFLINVFGAAGETVLLNNIGSINYIGAVSGPDLAVSFPSQSFTLTGGQTSNVQILVQNLNISATAFGPLSLSFAMPTGGFFSTSPASFLTNGWSCNTVGSLVSCLYGGGLSGGASSLLTIPLMPTNQAGGVVLNPSFAVLVSGVTGELNLLNNQALLQYNGLVQSIGVRLALKGVLQGAVIQGTTLMRDRLRQLNLIPLGQPYLSGGVVGTPAYTLPNTVANVVTNQNVLNISGNNAIVDWVLVELRSGSNPSVLVGAMPALIQVDGDVVSASDGTSPITFAGVTAGNYYVTLRHRNHLGIRSAQAVTLVSGLTTYDMTVPANIYVNPTLGTRPAYVDQTSGKAMLWACDTNGDGYVIFQGSNSDVDPIFSLILFRQITNPLSNFVVTAYTMSDVNLDGQVIFQGQDNEVDLLFFNVLTHRDNLSFLANFIIYQHY